MVLRAISSVFQERSFEGIEPIAHRVTAYHAPSIFYWQRANEECIDSAEDRGVRANPEGEYGDRDKAEDRRFPKLAERVAKLTHWFLSLVTGHFFRSFGVEGDNGIDGAGAARGQPAGNEGDEHERRREEQERNRIARAGSVEKRRDQSR